jgi:formate dehydrogenase subunit gamma
MPLSSDAVLARFTRAERALHWSVAVLMIILIATAACLYVPVLSGVVGNRPIVRMIHIIAGFALPIPIILAMFTRAFRMDAQRLNRFTSYDWQWLKSKRARARGTGVPVGKFNAGQKLNAAFSFGAILIMFATGMVMFFSSLFTDDIRTGATFVHDWLTLVIVVALTGHIYMAMKDTEARMGMRTGEVTQGWAQKHHPQWAAVNSGSGATEPEVHPVDKDQT